MTPVNSFRHGLKKIAAAARQTPIMKMRRRESVVTRVPEIIDIVADPPTFQPPKLVVTRSE